MLEVLEMAARQVYTAFSNLIILAVFFVLLAYLLKGKEVYKQVKPALTGSAFNFSLMSVNLLLLTPVMSIILTYLYGYQWSIIDRSIWYDLPQPVAIFIAVFLGDFIGYWRHRFEHSRFLWPLHRVHHTDEHMNWLTLQRFHPLNYLTTFIIDTSFLILLGVPPFAIVANNMIRNYYGYFIHADIPWTYGKWSAIFVSPAMHRWHHATQREAYQTNFATVFSVFDRAFGTYRVPGPCNTGLGVRDGYSKSFFGELLHPFNFRVYWRKKPKKE
ncbi:sterol desaturase family protein [Pseudoalteromonas luteoviolacea]|uniref:sterol desaturase family protein n=1 Tax=Pseudoalteromonas luteoviolacea TaxID=43657 RepID=UPI00115147C6|nr:sterol desaturase family protein [Pseudoalteromonas luteoviolacea]TQF70362.1 sterol desaturase family protein [Pseudoalteromonas luteoviolacea]